MQPSAPMRPPVIGFLTDFGFDGAAATCRAVMLSICPGAQIVDISHAVPKYAVADGAFVLAAALPYFPIGVHIGVVDPGVGTERRPIGLRAGRGDILVGPDNGLLVPAAEALGGIAEVRELSNRDWWLPVISSTFHGRDIFAPVAAHLASGAASFESIGAALEAATIERLPAARARLVDGSLHTEVTYVDSFGNVRLAGTRDDLVAVLGGAGTAAVTIAGGARTEVRFVRTFGEVPPGEALLYVDSSGHPALGTSQDDFAAQSGVGRGDRVVVERA